MTRGEWRDPVFTVGLGGLKAVLNNILFGYLSSTSFILENGLKCNIKSVSKCYSSLSKRSDKLISFKLSR